MADGLWHSMQLKRNYFRSIAIDRDPLLVPVEVNVIELLAETSFRLLGLTLTGSMDWKPYSPLPRLLRGR